MDKYERKIGESIVQRQNDFLASIQNMPTPYALALVNSIFESVYAHVELNGLRNKSLTRDQFLDDTLKHLKTGILKRIEEEQYCDNFDAEPR